MTKRKLIDYCLIYPSVFEGYSFDDINAIMKHSGNNKMIALIGERNGVVYINLKCEPMRADRSLAISPLHLVYFLFTPTIDGEPFLFALTIDKEPLI